MLVIQAVGLTPDQATIHSALTPSERKRVNAVFTTLFVAQLTRFVALHSGFVRAFKENRIDKCSLHVPNTSMIRIDPDSLATHIEVALVCAPQDTLEALQAPDRHRRRIATTTLAQHLADRLGCFEITAGELGGDGGQASLFQDAPRVGM
jgi:hypothetical protein